MPYVECTPTPAVPSPTTPAGGCLSAFLYTPPSTRKKTKRGGERKRRSAMGMVVVDGEKAKTMEADRVRERQRRWRTPSKMVMVVEGGSGGPLPHCLWPPHTPPSPLNVLARERRYAGRVDCNAPLGLRHTPTPALGKNTTRAVQEKYHNRVKEEEEEERGQWWCGW